MARPDGRVEPRQKLATAFSARAWNRAQDAADIVLGDRGGVLAGAPKSFDRAPNIVMVQNSSSGDVGRFGVLGINGVSINPAASAAAANRFAEGPVLRGERPLTAIHSNRFVVLLEPIAAGAVGRAVIGGVFACKVYVNDTAHRFATVRNTDVTQLQTTTCGPVQLLWVETSEEKNNLWAVGVM